MKNVHKELQGIVAEVEAVNAAMRNSAKGLNSRSINTEFLNKYSQKLREVEETFHKAIDAQGAFDRQSMSFTSHSDRLLESLQRQKFGLRDLIKERKNLSQVYKDQIALQKSAVMQWGKDSSGAIRADLLTPRTISDAGKGFSELTKKAGFYNQVLASVADQTVKWGKNTQWAGRQLMAGISMPIAAMGAATGVLAYQIDKGLTQVVKVYGDAATAAKTTDEEIKAATLSTARAMASAYGQSAQDSIEITAQLASAGAVGKELQADTAQVTRARTLGELDLQDAMKATITLQSVYNMNSQKLGETFDFMNSMENQTNLTMQDFVVGIPKVSGVLKEFGGDVQDAGILLAGMKAAGIDAAEGANAIKSIAFKIISPNQGSKDMFESLTGTSFEETMKGTEGVVERLQALGKVTAGLGQEERVGLIQKMFGLYQGSKTLSLLSQLTDGSEQMTRAFEVAAGGAASWSETANRELEKLQNSGWNKVKQQWESLKIELLDVGNVFLKMAAPIVEFFVKVVKGFNDLDPGIKKFILWGAAIVGLAGPIIMLAGLFGNLIGNVGKLTTFITGLMIKFKLQNKEQMTAERLSHQVEQGTIKEADAFGFLALQIREATSALKGLASADIESKLAAFDAQRVVKQNGKGVPMYTKTPGGRAVPANGPNYKNINNGQLSRDRDQAYLMNETRTASGTIATNSEKTSKSWKDISANSKIYAAAGVAGAVSMVAPTGSTLSNVANTALIASTIVPMLGKIKAVSFAVQTIGTNARFAGTVMKSAMAPAATALKGMGKSIIGFLPALGPVGAAIGVLGTAIGAAYYVMHKNIEKAKKEATEFANSAQTYAKVLGFEFQTAAQGAETAKNKIVELQDKTNEFLKQNEGAAKKFKSMQSASEDDKLSMAANEAAKVRLHGGSVEAGVEAAQIALKAMNSKIASSEVEFRLRAKFDITNMDSIVNNQLNNVQDAINKAVDSQSAGKSEKTMRFIKGTVGLTETAKIELAAQGKELWNIFANASEEQQPVVFGRITQQTMARQNELFEQIKKGREEQLKKLGIETASDLAKYAARGGVLGGADIAGTGHFDTSLQTQTMGGGNTASGLGLDPKTITMWNQASLGTVEVLRSIGAQAGLTADEMKNVYTMDDIVKLRPELSRLAVKFISITEAGRLYDNFLAQSKTGVVNWTDAQKLARLNLLRTRAGLSETKNILDGFGDATDKNTNQLYDNAAAHKAVAEAMRAKNGITDSGASVEINAETAQQMIDRTKSTYSGAMETVYTEAARILDAQNQAALDSLQNQADKESAIVDADEERQKKRFENQNRALETRFSSLTKALDAKQKARKDAIEKSYDDRIKKIDATIKAEQAAEEQRQKIFEAEKLRIQRMADLYNRNIDINMAINSGNLDEAAKLQNDSIATQAGWLIDDQSGTSQTETEKRVSQLESAKAAAEEQKKVKLDALDAVETREKEALDAQKQREQDSLKSSQDTESKRLDARRKAIDANLKNATDAAKKEQDLNKRKLDIELAQLRAFVPQNEQQLAQHIKRVEVAYDGYGGKLTEKGTGWGNTVGTALKNATKTATIQMSNEIAWEALGKVAADKMASGAFNMTLGQFMNWVSTGALPTGYQAPSSISKAEAAQYNAMGIRVAGVNAASGLTKHKGGVIDGSRGGSSRAGYSGKNLSQSEVNITALKGESVLTRAATRELGTDFVDMANKGILPKGVGGDLSGVGGLMAGLMGGMLRGALSQGLATAGNRQMAMDSASGSSWSATSGKAGRYGDANFDATQLRNAATIAATGKSVGASSRDIIIALMTAMQESTLRNLNYGDRDSLGLFQQRNAWGSSADRTNPAAAARMFFLGGKAGQRGLLDFPNRGKMSLGAAAQAVQVSAYPGAYSKWQNEAEAIAASLQFAANGGMGGELTPGGWIRPASGPRTSGYGMRWGRMHTGSDIGGVIGRPIYAARSGRVVQAKVRGNKGNHIQLDHGGGIQTGYSHLSRFGVAVGDSVRQGQQIGWMGNTGNSTGPHLHFEYLKDGKTLNPNLIIPGLKTGGFTMSDGLAMLHKNETVLTAPLSETLKQGINNMDKSQHAMYNVNMNFDGANLNSEIDFKKVVKESLMEIEKQNGMNRRIGDKN